MKRVKFTPEKEAMLLDPAEDAVKRAAAIDCMHSDGVVRHEELMVSFLDHKSPYLRAAALRILLRWGRFEYTDLAIQWLRDDPDDVVRSKMTSALAWVAHCGNDFEKIARALVAAIENDVDRGVSADAYRAARVIIVPEGWFDAKIDYETFDSTRDVDWSLLNRYREEFNN